MCYRSLTGDQRPSRQESTSAYTSTHRPTLQGNNLQTLTHTAQAIQRVHREWPNPHWRNCYIPVSGLLVGTMAGSPAETYHGRGNVVSHLDALLLTKHSPNSAFSLSRVGIVLTRSPRPPVKDLLAATTLPDVGSVDDWTNRRYCRSQAVLGWG